MVSWTTGCIHVRDGSIPTWHSTRKGRGDLKPLPVCSIFPYPCKEARRSRKQRLCSGDELSSGYKIRQRFLSAKTCHGWLFLSVFCVFVCFSNYLFTVTLQPGPSCWDGGCWAPRAAAPSGSPTYLTWVRKQTWKALAFSPKSEMLMCPATYSAPLPFFLNGVIEHATSFACKLRWHL